jgi:hypothetical protein
MTTFYASIGILHQHTCVGTPQQNSVVEENHSIYSMLLALLDFKQICLCISGVTVY